MRDAVLLAAKNGGQAKEKEHEKFAPSIAMLPPIDPLTACDRASLENSFDASDWLSAETFARSSILSPRLSGTEGLRSTASVSI